MAGVEIEMNEFGQTEDDIKDDIEDDIFDDGDYFYDDGIDDGGIYGLPDTPLHNPGKAGEDIDDLRLRLKRTQLAQMKKNLVIAFYESVASEYGLPMPEKIPYKQFKISKTGKTLYWNPEEGKLLTMMKQKGGGFLALSTLENKYRKTYGQGGADAIKNSMEVEYRSKMPKLSPEAQENLKQARANLPKGSEEITPAVADQAIASVQNILAVLTSEGYTTRDILGMCKALERSRGELTNNLAKLSELDEHIALEKRKLEETPNEAAKDEIAKRLRDLQNQRAPRLEAASATREALRSQISRLRETLHQILHEDKTLAERIKTLFREQGITIASILTALGMIISTIVLAIPGGSGGAAPPQPPGKGGAKEWIKKQLQSLGRILAKLAGKAAAALPGIIGSIVSWLLSLLGKTAVWLSSNLWAVLLAVGGLLLVAAREWLLLRNQSSPRPMAILPTMRAVFSSSWASWSAFSAAVVVAGCGFAPLWLVVASESAPIGITSPFSPVSFAASGGATPLFRPIFGPRCCSLVAITSKLL